MWKLMPLDSIVCLLSFISTKTHTHMHIDRVPIYNYVCVKIWKWSIEVWLMFAAIIVNLQLHGLLLGCRNKSCTETWRHVRGYNLHHGWPRFILSTTQTSTSGKLFWVEFAEGEAGCKEIVCFKFSWMSMIGAGHCAVVG